MNSNILGKKGISFSNIQEVTLSKSNVKAADIIPHGKRRIISRDPGETLSSEGVTFNIPCIPNLTIYIYC
jgi:hypothetical protein